ncbi:MAG: Rieske 2Fe-2S domain-containing protein, partial [Candidatus Sumerlaeaceae bacterium]|nr:Rieske 2Fe-2S domain-containing protein [Candidatus Sumerlaeaceae bacterium]
MSHPSRWLPIAKAANLSQDGSSQKFFLHTPDGFLLEGLIIRKNGQLFAYANRCPHMPLSLDYGDGEFFDEARDWLICRNHGAVFDPQNGRCVAGPCYGAVSYTHLRAHET